jgi:ATP-dependent RNA helicase RhlE
MLDLGFLPDVWKILQLLPEHRQMMLFSATMPPAVERLAARFMKEPVRVDLRPTGKVAEGIEHRLYLVRPEDKKPCLLSLLSQDSGSTLVFIRRKIDAEWLCKVLEKQGHPVARMHSDRSQRERVAALEGFREGKHRILVATDVAARGIDVAGIQHIVNFNLPDTVDDYVHRAGRTARLDAVGIVSSIATWQDKPIISEIEKALGAPIPRCAAPGIERWEELSRTRRGKKIRRRRLL